MIVVSLLTRDFAGLRELALVHSLAVRSRDRAPAEAEGLAREAIELRLDGLSNPGAVDERVLAELIRDVRKPVIVAVNASDAHGRFTGSDDERLEILARAGRAGAAFVDVDWRLARAPLALPASCRRIVSRHETDHTPDDLERAFGELVAVARPDDVLKFVAHARTAEDGARMLEFARTLTRDAIVFSSGEAGRFTRILAPIFGSFATYAAPARGIAEVLAVAKRARELAPEPPESRDTPQPQKPSPLAEATSPKPHALVDGGPTAPGQLRVDELRAAWPRNGVTRETAVYAVVGRPVRHSLSPRLHGAVFRESARDAVYVAIEPQALETFLPLCRAPNWRGLSVTAPFKQAACELADVIDDVARDARAANTLVRTFEGGWIATNTDTLAVEDIVRAGLERARVTNRSARALVIGTGGAARAALCALDRIGCESIVLTGRDFHKTIALALDRAVEAAELGDVVERTFDIVVQCTPAGSTAQPDVMPIDACVLRTGQVFVEAVYRPTRTPLVVAAERVGAVVVLGTEWFLAQARGQAQKFAQGPWSDAALQRELTAALAEDVPFSIGDASLDVASEESSDAEDSDDFATSTRGSERGPNAVSPLSNRGRAATPAAPKSDAATSGTPSDARKSDATRSHAGESDATTADNARADTVLAPSTAKSANERPLSASRAPAHAAKPTPNSVHSAHLTDAGARLSRAFPRKPHASTRSRLERTIALVGLRASGKTSVAIALAHELGATCVDLDDQIVRLVDDPALTRVGDVLRVRGEAEFRRLESMALTALLTCGEPLVVATGGGVVESESNRALLAAHSAVVWLRVPVEELQRRLAADPTPRPPLLGADPIAEVPEVARRREPLYTGVATLTVEAGAASPEALVQQLVPQLRSLRPLTIS